MKKILVILISIFCFSSIVNSKTIIIGSHGGPSVYLGGSDYSYCPTVMHWDHGQVELRNAEDVARVPDNNGYILANGKEWNGHGIDASIVYYQNQRLGERVYSVIFDQASTITVAHKYIELVYDKGDKIFLVGYSAGGDFMMTLADWMNSNDYPIHLLGLIDPFVLSSDITIPSNVKKVALYHQESDDPGWKGFIQGFNSFILQGSETRYFSGHPVLIEGVNHSEIDNSVRVWQDLGEKMLAEADDYEPEEGLVESKKPPEPKIAGYYYEEGTGVISVSDQNNLDTIFNGSGVGIEEINNFTPDLHFTSVKGGFASEDEDKMNNSITENLYPGQCIKVSFVARYINESDQTAEEVDFDWRSDQENNRFDEDDDKLCDENKEDVKAHTKNKKTFKNASLCVSEDGTKITLTGPDGNISSDFKYNQDKGSYIAKLYVFGDVEEKGRSNGDQDISSENGDESTEIEITLISFKPNFTISTKEIIGPATVNFTDTTEGFVSAWNWNFGDGTTSTEINPSHYYTKFGTHKVTMTVGNGEFTADTSQAVTIKKPPAPSITITEPRRGKKWKSNKEYRIKWNYKNLPKNEPIKIEYSCNGGKRWRTIYRGYTNNDGSKKWKMKKSKTKDSKNCYIRILRRSDGSVLGISPKFRIDHKRKTPKW